MVSNHRIVFMCEEKKKIKRRIVSVFAQVTQILLKFAYVGVYEKRL